jgi:DNA-binding beta-propeller fold protein YncE
VDLYARDAPEFPDGLEWLNVARPLSMAGLRGKIVLVDFWTYGCVNCIHNLPELKRLQAEYPDELVVIGVHSAKFTAEAETENIRRIIQRYELNYPVVNDKSLTVWHTWGARAWPTLVLVDAAGVMAALHVGEGAYRVMKPLVATLIREAEGRGRLDRTPLTDVLARETRPATVLAFPGKVRADPAGGRLFIADSGHHRVVVVDTRSDEVLAVIGSGERGLRDGDLRAAAFDTPQGMALAPGGGTLYVADTGNHALRAVDLAAGQVTTIAGTGSRAQKPQVAARPALDAALSSPWDLALDGRRLFVAMAGLHQVWLLNLNDGTIGPYAGSGLEGVAGGPRADADLAQPSGLALDGRGALFLADTESSAVRRVGLGARGEVETLAGARDLFAFGDADGVGRAARLQHPQGIAYAEGALYIADTYNHKIKRLDPATGAVRTLFGGAPGWRDGAEPLFYEPGGLDVAGGVLYVADTNNHAVRAVDLAGGQARTLVLRGIERFTPSADEAGYRGVVVRLPPVTVAPGAGIVRLDIALPPGYKVNDLAPSSVAWRVEGGVVSLPADADRSLAGLRFPLELPATFTPGAGELVADLTVIYCEAVTPDLCLIEEARVVAPLTVAAGGAGAVELRHSVPPP